MSLCPNCKGEFARRKEGKCPECGIDITLYQGRWFNTNGKSPVTIIFRKWESLLSDRLSTQFFIPEKSSRYKAEMRHTINLLDLSEWDVEGTLRALEILFTDPRFTWKTYASVIQMWSDFPVALAIAKELMGQDEQQQHALDRQWENLEAMEDVFNDNIA